MVEQRQKGGGANRRDRRWMLQNQCRNQRFYTGASANRLLMAPLGGQTSEKSCRVVHRASGSLSLRQGWR